MRHLSSLVMGLVVAGSACCRSAAKPDAPVAVPVLDPTCATDDGTPLPSMNARESGSVYRVELASGAITPIKAADARTRAGTVATIEHDRLVISRAGHVLIDAAAHGADDVTWQIERDGVMYVSLSRANAQTFQAFDLAAAPRLKTLWCHAVSNVEHGANSTKTGPLVIQAPHSLVAVRPATGEIAWRIPWTEASAPFTLLESGSNWIACERDIVALDRDSGAERWNRAGAPSTAVDCWLAGGQILAARRRCDTTGCTPTEITALDPATGATLFTTPGAPYTLLTPLDRDHALVDTGIAIAILDTRTGHLDESLALPGSPWSATRLADGDVLLGGAQTFRISVAPLAVRWHVLERYDFRLGDQLLATRADHPPGAPYVLTGATSLVTIDVASGAERSIALPPEPPPSWSSYYELGGATILGASATEVDVAVGFGFYEK